jgi:hypothetical protein
MRHAVAYSDLESPENFDPTPEEIAPVAASILAYFKANPNAWHEALSECAEHGKPSRLGEALRDGDWTEAGRLAHEAALSKLTEDADDLAESWLVDSLTIWDKKRLAEWRPVKYASLGKRYHLAEMLS